MRRRISVPALEVAASGSSFDRRISKKHRPAVIKKRPMSGSSSHSRMVSGVGKVVVWGCGG